MEDLQSGGVARAIFAPSGAGRGTLPGRVAELLMEVAEREGPCLAGQTDTSLMSATSAAPS